MITTRVLRLDRRGVRMRTIAVFVSTSMGSASTDYASLTKLLSFHNPVGQLACCPPEVWLQGSLQTQQAPLPCQCPVSSPLQDKWLLPHWGALYQVNCGGSSVGGHQRRGMGVCQPPLVAGGADGGPGAYPSQQFAAGGEVARVEGGIHLWPGDQDLLLTVGGPEEAWRTAVLVLAVPGWWEVPAPAAGAPESQSQNPEGGVQCYGSQVFCSDKDTEEAVVPLLLAQLLSRHSAVHAVLWHVQHPEEPMPTVQSANAAAPGGGAYIECQGRWPGPLSPQWHLEPRHTSGHGIFQKVAQGVVLTKVQQPWLRSWLWSSSAILVCQRSYIVTRGTGLQMAEDPQHPPSSGEWCVGRVVQPCTHCTVHQPGQHPPLEPPPAYGLLGILGSSAGEYPAVLIFRRELHTLVDLLFQLPPDPEVPKELRMALWSASGDSGSIWRRCTSWPSKCSDF